MLGKREEEILGREMLRIDPLFKDFLYVAKFASVYHYAHDEWNKIDIEGTFVMYGRCMSPSISIHIFNRKSLRDFVFSIRRDTQVGADDGLMTLQNSREDGIYGIWFQDDTHPEMILDCLRANL